MDENHPKSGLNATKPIQARQIDLEEEIAMGPYIYKEQVAPSTMIDKESIPAKVPIVTWSIRGVSSETRKLIEEAAESKEMTIGRYINERVKAFAHQDLNQDPNDLESKVGNLEILIRELQTSITDLSKANQYKKKGFRFFWQR